MPEDPPRARPLGYALNVFPYHTLAELWTCLETDVLRLKDRAFPDAPFPVELRFSEPLVRELQQDCQQVARLKHFLETRDLALVTVNAFVLPRFHGERVKERVYRPAWHESPARQQFTQASLELLDQLAPPALEFGSVSVPFGALKPVPMDAIAPPILAAGRHAQALHRRTGRRLVIGLEPEPGLTVETTAEAIDFFGRFVPADLREYLTVNFDLAHQLVQFEDPVASLAQLAAAEVPVSKIHVSNAAELTALNPFYEDSIYLHQVCGADAAGRRVYFSLDWPTDPPPPGIVRFRVHYHLPVCAAPQLGVGTTLSEIEQFLTRGLPSLDPIIPAIIETYTWPQQLGRPDRLVEHIAGELDWVRKTMAAG